MHAWQTGKDMHSKVHGKHARRGENLGARSLHEALNKDKTVLRGGRQIRDFLTSVNSF